MAGDIDDPFAVLGVARGASAVELRAARRRLARELHPDHGGDAARMQAVNAAFDAAMAELARLAASPATAGRAPPRGTAAGRAPSPAPGGGASTVRPRVQGGRASRPSVPRRAQWDPASFVIELPVPDAYEALVVVSTWIGELVGDDAPHVLEVLLAEPGPCWCRLELLPEGRATSVSLAVAPAADDELAPTVTEVRDTWVAQLNQLAHWER